MTWFTTLLDRITMYRLLLYYLIVLLGVAALLSLFGVLHFSAIDIIFSSLFITAICLISNKIFAYAFDAPTNVESVYITALILALIITPTTKTQAIVFLAAASGLAIASKFMLAIHHKHIFNPAAIAVVLTGLGAGDTASWWIGTPWMAPFVLIGGLLVVYKTERWRMVLMFMAIALVGTAVLAGLSQSDITATLSREILSSPLLFTAFVMLTEPLTSPTTRSKQGWYGTLVGALFPPQINFWGVFITPEISLVMGNIFTYSVGPRVRQQLMLTRRVRLSADTFDFVFEPKHSFTFIPGQYMEFTLQHPHTDSRGARRYFTIASSPTEKELRLGIKFYEQSSSFKQTLLNMPLGSQTIAAQVGGDFSLPKDPQQKIAFIAGGIGVTPYRSMLKYLLDTKETRSITMLYAAKTAQDIVYQDVLGAAQTQLGLRLHYAINGQKVDADFIRAQIPDFYERLFYISGPHSLVVAVERALRKLGVRHSSIKKDFFSGYA